MFSVTVIVLLMPQSSGGNLFPRHSLMTYYITNILLYSMKEIYVIARSKRDGTRAETRFGHSAKRTSPFKSAGVSVQSTAGSRGVRISGQQLYRPCSDIQCKAAGYPLHSHLSPSLPPQCVTVCHQVPNALYLIINISLHSVEPKSCLSSAENLDPGSSL